MVSKIGLFSFVIITTAITVLLAIIVNNEFGIWSGLSVIGSGLFGIVYFVFIFLMKPQDKPNSQKSISEIF